jgi:uncharacterized protein YdcH (DUF465 family)
MKIPRDNRRGMIEQQVPTADINVRGAGMQGEAMEKLGQEIATIGYNYGQQAEEAEADDFAFKARNEDEIATEEYATKLKLEVGEDPVGYSDKMKSFLEDRIKTNDEAAPSGKAREKYAKYAQTTYAKHYIDAHGYETTRRAEYWRDNIDKQANELASLNLENPDPAKTMENYAVVEDMITKSTGRHYTAEQATQMLDKTKLRFTDSVLSGYTKNERYNEGLAFLKSDHPMVATLDTKVKGNFIEQMTNGVQRQQREQAHEISAQTRDVVYQLNAGENVPAAELKILQARISSNPQIKGDEKTRTLDTLKSAQQVNTLVKKLSDANPEEMNKLQAELDTKLGDGTFNAATHGQLKQGFQEAKNRVLRERNEDGAWAWMKNSVPGQNLFKQAQSGSAQDMKRFLDVSLARQTELGIPPSKQRVLPKFYSNDIANTLLATGTNPQGATTAISQLAQKFGPNFEKAFDELTQDHKDIDKGLIVAAHAVDDNSRYGVVNNVFNRTDINKKFETNGGDSNYVNTLVDTKMNGVANALLQTSNDSSPLGVTNAMADMVSLEAKRLLGEQKMSDPDKAVEAAYASVIDKNFYTRDAANSTLIMPKKFKGYGGAMHDVDPEKVANFARHYSNAENIAELNPVVPKQWEGHEAQWHEMLAEKGKWVTSPDRQGLRFVVQADDGKFYKAYGKDKKPIERDFLNITNMWEDVYLQKYQAGR